jgi:hypothetical protein
MPTAQQHRTYVIIIDKNKGGFLFWDIAQSRGMAKSFIFSHGSFLSIYDIFFVIIN